MTDPLHLAAALDFLTSSPARMAALSPTSPERRRAMLEDAGGALAYFAVLWGPSTGPAQQAALQVLELAADVWREYLPTFTGSFDPDTAALNLHAWACKWTISTTEALPEPLYALLADSFPNLGDWAKLIRALGVMSSLELGTAAGWWAVCALAALCAGTGFEDGEAEDLIDALLSGLGTLPGRVMN